MRWTYATAALIGTGAALALAEACGPKNACTDYCAEVAARLEDCELADHGDFDVTDCEDRTADVEADTCATTTTRVRNASCNEMKEGFCPDGNLHCPKECFSECCADSDCPAEKPRCDSGSCAACLEASQDVDCTTHTCKYGECVECSPETEALACAPDQGCNYDQCLKRCLKKEDCGAFRECLGNFCSEPIGTACEDGTDCGPGFCETIDSKVQKVPGYCTITCFDTDATPCPDGYTCVDYECRP